MEIKETGLEGLLVIKPQVFKDNRGHFFECYNKSKFNKEGLIMDFVQDNQSLSGKGIVRGLHFQKPPYAQGKLVRVIKGAVLDVVLDIRKNSPTYGKSFSIELSEDNFTMLWIPVGFAHGFKTIKEDTIFFYKCTNFYNKESEGALRWNDPALNIDWEIDNPILSDKDKESPFFKDLNSPF